jgi:hypothetical protein
MDSLHEVDNAYNHSIAIIQSSGMGKSRLVDRVAQIKICFPFNLRGPLNVGQFGKIPMLVGESGKTRLMFLRISTT